MVAAGEEARHAVTREVDVGNEAQAARLATRWVRGEGAVWVALFLESPPTLIETERARDGAASYPFPVVDAWMPHAPVAIALPLFTTETVVDLDESLDIAVGRW